MDGVRGKEVVSECDIAVDAPTPLPTSCGGGRGGVEERSKAISTSVNSTTFSKLRYIYRGKEEGKLTKMNGK